MFDCQFVLHAYDTIQEDVFKMECVCVSVSAQQSISILPLLADWLCATTANNDWLSLPDTMCHNPVALYF